MYPSSKSPVICLAAILCIAGCLADLVLIYYFGSQIPGYNPMKSSISSLGESGSPVSIQVTYWSVALGFIFIFFGYGIYLYNGTQSRYSRLAFLLIAVYSLGDCIASGIFRPDHINGELSNSAIIHNAMGGIGVTSLLLFTRVMKKLFTRESHPYFFYYSSLVFFTGLAALILFSFRIDYFSGTLIYACSGLWQRIFLINYYLYFSTIAVLMLLNLKSKDVLSNS